MGFNRILTAREWLGWLAPKADDPKWDLAAEAIVVKIRWFGLAVGFLIANWGTAADHWPLNLILLPGFIFTLVDTIAYRSGRVFLRDFPLLISALEALFIAVLCYFESGPESPFRFYYLLSLICSAFRYSPRITVSTCILDCLSYGMLFLLTPDEERSLFSTLLTVVVLAWVTWAAAAMARLLKRASENFRRLNAALEENQRALQSRIETRTRELEESRAQVLHQEKMAAFGLLAAGIAHEVGNPLTSISGVVQMLERRDPDEYTREKLTLVNGQLSRIQSILRELVTFSRPASDVRGKVSIPDVIDEALGIAKYYKGGKNRHIIASVAKDLPVLIGVRDQLVQVIFNLVLNAIDATGKGGTIRVAAGLTKENSDSPISGIEMTVSDDGAGIAYEHRDRLFRPYFTTKRQGTGLGLFVIRRIVESHGGRVSFSSEPQVGTTFRVVLPTVEEITTPRSGNETRSESAK